MTVEMIVPDEATIAPSAKRGRTSRLFARSMRWLHIYLSMISFAVVLFFSATGLTLNHPSWLGGDKESIREAQGKLNPDWLKSTDTSLRTDSSQSVSRLEIIEHLRSHEKIRGAVKEFLIDEYQVIVTLKAPAYSADIFIDRETGEYELVEVSLGFTAVLNDLHKGRDAGKSWAWVIDVSAVSMIILSLTGFTLIFYIKRHRIPALFACLLGAVVCIILYLTIVPT